MLSRFTLAVFGRLGLIVWCVFADVVPVSAADAVERKNQASLTQDYAVMRAKQISDVSYKLSMEIDEQKPAFKGEVSIQFNVVKENTSPVTVDFDGGDILSVSLNGQSIPWKYDKWFIRFAPELFREKQNRLIIQFTRPYATAGDGLHRYKDSVTNNVYLYSNFEPFNAHKMFPHFDQPNIKATYTLDVLAPLSWQVISTTRETNVDEVNGKKHWQFSTTPKMASYVFSLHAGPYKMWEDNSGSIPLRLFARQELAQYVDAKECFLFTQQSFAFYNQYFGLPYPFKKYDQLIVPDFNSGAMENIGAVTFNENYVGRGIKTELERMRYGNVIAHEMAHMWFGDLVTMNWWNGLWLNESFATYMSFLAQEKSSEFGSKVWDVFYSGTKQWAYTSDQQVTTHSIELSVDDTAEAFANFDGITYGKGASVLKQLAYYVGEDNFQKGVARYLKKYSYGNTQLADFMDEIAHASHKNLHEWTDTWLNQPGLNSIELKYSCVEKKQGEIIKNMQLVQTAPAAWPILRNQKIQIGLFNVQDTHLVQTQVLPLVYSGDVTSIRAVKGAPCPAFAYPNVGDYGYAKIMLDERSLETIKIKLNHFDGSMRLMLWQNLWDSVLDVRMPLSDYLHLVQTFIGTEERIDIVSAVAAKLKTSRDYFWLMSDSNKIYTQELQLIESIAQQELLRAKAGSDVQKIWFDAFAQAAHTPSALAEIHALFTGEERLQGFVIDQDRRWAMLLRLNQFQYSDYMSLTDIESRKDQSDTGRQMALACEAIRPESNNKQNWFTQITAKDKTYKLASLRVVMGSLLPLNQRELRADYADKIYSSLEGLNGANDDRFMFSFLGFMLPRACNEVNLLKLKSAHSRYGNLSPALNRSLLVGVQEEQRCIDMKALLVK